MPRFPRLRQAGSGKDFMIPLILFLFALAGAVLLQAFIRMLLAPGRSRVAAMRRSARENPVDRKAA
jgi:hypothetical protein